MRLPARPATESAAKPRFFAVFRFTSASHFRMIEMTGKNSNIFASFCFSRREGLTNEDAEFFVEIHTKTLGGLRWPKSRE